MGSDEDWYNSYHGRVRAAMGSATLFFLAARGVIRDGQGRVLLIKRTDNGYWAFPAGAMELGESMRDCAIRETFEETGLKAGNAVLFAFLSGPQYTFTNVFGDTYQHISGSYLLTDITGELDPDPYEASDCGWFAPDALPEPTSGAVTWTLEHLARFEQTGEIFVD
ncbi:NUDIX domain-containing protein [Catellatospora tritici]|uniref:NUDIX domain-containing protein n=1 Tax=Catellatospora tritici TaxID=2851566 RepID=UPI0020C30D22|nr:NUDIX domain-containing protein [Catellatospora tritici]